MVENTQNSFEEYIGLFTFYIIPINYATFMGQILIFEPSWVQNTIVPYKISQTLLFFNNHQFNLISGSKKRIW